MVERRKFIIPEGVAPTVKEIITPIIDEINEGGLTVDLSGSDKSTYGHALRNLMTFAFGSGESRQYSDEEQLRLLKERAQQLVDIYGPKIVEMMDPKLLEALGIKLD